MKILLIDPAGAFVDFALKCMAHGHEVKQWIKKYPDGSESAVGKGLIPRVTNWQIHMKWADLTVLSDNAYQMRELEKYHKQGYPIMGASSLTSDLELDRGFGQDILKKAGLDVIESTTFNDYNSAIDFIKNNPKRYVSKPSGDVDKALSYVSKSPADMIFMLERWKAKAKLKQPFLMQEFVPGIEVAVGTWCGKNGFTGHICENWEFKKLMSSNFGVNTGEMGTVVKYVSESQLFEDTLAKVEDFLVYHNYTGYVDLAFIVDKYGSPRPLEWTTRPGWPLFNIQSSLHKGDPAEWMLDLCEGYDTLKTSKKTAIGVLAAIPDFPFTKQTGRDATGFPIYGLEAVMDSIHLCEVQMGKAPNFVDGKIIEEEMLVSAGDYLFIATGCADDVVTAKKRAYEVIDEINVPNSLMVRDDIGERLEKELPILQSYGYCTDFTYDKSKEE